MKFNYAKTSLGMETNRPQLCATMLATALALLSTLSTTSAEDARKPMSADKTLVSWVTLTDRNLRAGSVLTLQRGPEFDGIIFAEKAPGKWMAGSHAFQRTQDQQESYPAETTDGKTLLQMAIVYNDDTISIYRNGEPYASYKAKNIDLLSGTDNFAVFGLRHVGGNGSIGGSIEDARIYGKALSVEELKSLEPNKKSAIEPYAWWDFEGGKVADLKGVFTENKLQGGTKVVDGKLVLGANASLVARRPYVPDHPSWPENPPTNWLTYHLAHPGPGPAMPGDPNCIFDYKGRVHLHYIYRNAWGFVFGHLSSSDMVRWKWHPSVLAPPTTGHGMFSGTGFYTKDGRPAIIYHGQGAGRNVIQYPADDSFDSWTKPVAVLPKTADGKTPNIRHWDPDCWLMDDIYYAYSGGQNPQLMKSTDLENWTYLGDLLHPDYPSNLGMPKEEDISCGNMFKIGDKWMLLCISHGKGARYYLGDFKDEKYLPSFHAMMSFGSNQFFAPESVLTRDGRRVMWAWLLNMPIAPTGVQSLPRELELPADGVLRIRPLRELSKLRYDAKSRERLTVKDGATVAINEVSGDAVELELIFAAPLPQEVGVTLLGDERGEGGMSIVAGAGRKTLGVGTTEPPFELADGEDLTLRVFIDKNLVEVFANDRQAAVSAVKSPPAEPNVLLYAKGGDATLRSIRTWRMKTIYTADPAEK